MVKLIVFFVHVSLYSVKYLHPACMQRSIQMKFNELNCQLVERKDTVKQEMH